jgi:hypothetical protein
VGKGNDKEQPKAETATGGSWWQTQKEWVTSSGNRVTVYESYQSYLKSKKTL